MYQVLVPIDEDEERASGQQETLLRLAEEMDELRVDILHVYEEIDVPADEAGSYYIDKLNENIQDIQGLPETVETIASSLEAADANVQIHDVTGEPAVGILQIADEYAVDAIVIGTRRRSPVGKVLFGSVAQSVILSSNCPVIVANG